MSPTRGEALRPTGDGFVHPRCYGAITMPDMMNEAGANMEPRWADSVHDAIYSVHELAMKAILAFERVNRRFFHSRARWFPTQTISKYANARFCTN